MKQLPLGSAGGALPGDYSERDSGVLVFDVNGQWNDKDRALMALCSSLALGQGINPGDLDLCLLAPVL